MSLHHQPPHPSDDRGAGFVEYALLVVLVVLALITVVEILGGDTSESIDSSASSVSDFG